MQKSRRVFLKIFSGSILTSLTLSLVQARNVFLNLAAAAGLKPLSEEDPLAKSLGYYKNASKVDAKKWTKRAGPDGKTQFCSNCMFYTPENSSAGKCQIFPANLVTAKGWCNTWAKKP